MNNLKKKSLKVSAIMAAAAVSLLLSFMIRTVLLRIFFASIFFLLALSVIFLLFAHHEQKNPCFKLKVTNRINWLIYTIAAASSFVTFCFPMTRYAFDDNWVFFVSLNAIEFIRVIAGCFILTIFPGYVAYRAFALNKLNDNFEKVALILTLSYIIDVILGLSLSQTVGFSCVNYLFSLWIFVLLCETQRYVFKRKNNVLITPTTKHESNDFVKESLVILVCLILVFSAYLITLSADPRDFSLGGDITDYISNSNAFLRGQQFDSPYAWFQIFLSIGSALTGLHPLHAFVCIQFLIILFPLSFYIFMVKIFKDSKIATVGTLITTVTGGLSSIGILGLFNAYDAQNVFATLWDLRTKTQNWPWLSNHFYIVATMDWSLLMLGLGFIYCFVEGKQPRRLGDLIFGSLLLASTFYTHNVIGIMIGLTAIFAFSVFSYRRLKRAVVLLLFVLLTLLAFDALSFNFFINTLFNYYLHYQVFFASSALFPYQWGIITIIILLFLVLLIPRLANTLQKKIRRVKSNKLFSIGSISAICLIIVLVVSIMSLALLAISFNYLNLPEETIFPWYIYVVRFSPFLQLAILSVPIMLTTSDEKRIGSFLMVSWCLLAILALMLNAISPRFFTPLAVNRVIMSIYLPLGALSSLTLSSLNMIKLPKGMLRFIASRVKFFLKKILMCSLIVSIGFSFLSYAYSIELFYQGNMVSSMSSEEKDLFAYLAGLSPQKIFLTYSYSTYRLLSAMTKHTTYAYYQYGAFTSWSTEILFKTSSPEIANYFLYRLGITHVVFSKQDSATLQKMTNSALVSMLNFFPIVFNNSFATVYSTPRYFLNESSNYILIKPLTKLSLDLTSESLIYDSIKPDNLRIVGGPSTFKFENGTIVQQVKDIKPPSAQYLQLYKGIAIPIALSPIASFKIKGTEKALYNIGFYDARSGWCWLSGERGLPSNFFSAPSNWTEMKIDLQSILDKDAMVQYIDFVATSSDGSPAEVKWKDFDITRNISVSELASNAYNLAYNSLTINEVPFTTTEDYKVLTLAPNSVYIFPYLGANSISNKRLFDDVKTGAYAVFFLCGSTYFSEDGRGLLNLLGVELRDLALVSNAYIDQGIYNFSFNHNVANLNTQNCLYAHNIMGYYTTSENTRIPLAITFTIGDGSIVLVNLPQVQALDRTLASIIIKVIKKVVSELPEPILSNALKTVPYPDDIFKLGNPALINIYKLKGLVDYIYAFSDIKLEGNISMSSNYIIWSEKNITIRRLVLQNTTYQKLFENVSIVNLHIAGSYNTTLTTQDATIYGLGDDLPILTTSSLNCLKIYFGEPAIDLKIEQNGGEKSLIVSNSYVEFEFIENFTTNLRLQKPLIMLNSGSLNTSWKGVFWHDGKMFTTVSTAESFPIIGCYSFRILNVNDVGLLSIADIKDIRVEIRKTAYWATDNA